jgi:hypothetical protein
MPRLDVRRLAAVDMYGTAGTQWRRRVITGEFIAGAIGCFALGLWVAFTAEAFGWRLFGAWLTRPAPSLPFLVEWRAVQDATGVEDHRADRPRPPA